MIAPWAVTRYTYLNTVFKYIFYVFIQLHFCEVTFIFLNATGHTQFNLNMEIMAITYKNDDTSYTWSYLKSIFEIYEMKRGEVQMQPDPGNG